MEMGQAAGYQVADYLQQHAGARRRMVKVPATCWQALCDHLTYPDDQRRAGNAAMDRLLYRYAEPPPQRCRRHRRQASRLSVGGLLAEQGRVEEALAVLPVRADASKVQGLDPPHDRPAGLLGLPDSAGET